MNLTCVTKAMLPLFTNIALDGMVSPINLVAANNTVVYPHY